MISKLKSVFSRDQNPEASSFSHPKVDSVDPTQCPFMKNKEKSKQKSDKCPYSGKNKDQKNVNSSDEESDEQEKPRGGCPFMQTGDKKKNPNLGIKHQGGYDQPFISKYKYYLSDGKINFSQIRRGLRAQPIVRDIFNTYPIYLKHTIFYNGDDFRKVRGFQCCSRFMAYQQLRERGNKFFNKGKYAKSLEFYERSMSLFRWLQYDENINRQLQSSTQLSANPNSQNSQDDEVGSNIDLNFADLNLEQRGIPNIPDRQQFDQFEKKYKQFFVVYSDKNVRYHDGEQMNEKPDIDMRNSLLIQLYLNMAAAYINLNHFSLAHQALNDALKISEKVSQVYLRKAQATLYNKGASLQELRIAQLDIQKAAQMRPNEKIFQNTNKNILKMVNIHDSEEVYNAVLEAISQRIQECFKKTNEKKHEIQKRLIHIRQVELQLIKQGKTPKQSRDSELLSNSQQYRIISRMYSKYIRILDFFNETKDKQQLILAKKEFQEVLRVISEIQKIENIQINVHNPSFGSDEQKIGKRAIRIKRQICDDIYNSGKFNFQVLEWAIKQIVNEQHQQKKKQQQLEKMQKQSAQSQMDLEYSVKKHVLSSKITYVAMLLPVIGLAVNYFLI